MLVKLNAISIVKSLNIVELDTTKLIDLGIPNYFLVSVELRYNVNKSGVGSVDSYFLKLSISTLPALFTIFSASY